MPQSPTTEALLQVLDDVAADVYQVMGAIKELSVRKECRAVVPLVALLERDRDDWISSTAARALGELGDRRAVESLRALIRAPAATVSDLPFDLSADADPLAGYAAAVVLAEMDDVRYEAVRALGLLADSAALADLLAVLARPDENHELLQAAARALGSLARASPGVAPGVRQGLEGLMTALLATKGAEELGVSMVQDRVRQTVEHVLRDLPR